MYNLGYDYFTGPPNSPKIYICKICDTICDKNQSYGPINSITAIAGSKSHFTKYACPNSKYDWHKKAYELLKYIKECPSDILNKIVQEELNYLLFNNKNE